MIPCVTLMRVSDFWTPRDTPLGQPAAPVPATPSQAYTQSFVPIQPAASHRRSRNGLWIALAVGVLVLVLAGGGIALLVGAGRGGKLPAAVTNAVQTSFSVTGSLTIASDCGSWGYDDLREGAEVTVTDESGKVLAVGALSGSGCVYTWQVNGVPVGPKLYGVTVGHRGAVHYTEAELRAGVQLSIGD